jgi:hypothetical protein
MRIGAWLAGILAFAFIGCRPEDTSPQPPPPRPAPPPATPVPSKPTDPPTPPAVRKPDEPPPEGRFARLEWESNRIPLYPGIEFTPPHSNEMNGIVILTHELTDPWGKVEAHYAQAFKDLGWVPEPGSADRWKHRDGGMELVLQLNEGQVVISLNLE